MSNDQPWLEDLHDDWIPPLGTPASSSPAQSTTSSHPTVQDTPSRIPIPARRLPGRSPADGKQKITRPCHFIKKEAPTPKYRSPRTPTKWRSPVLGKSEKSPGQGPTARGRQQLSHDTRSPLRSVVNAVSQKSQQDTVQIRPKGDQGTETTPEWRRRLVHGEMPASEQRDLFAPIGLESVFNPPSPTIEFTHERAAMEKPLSGILSATEDLKHTFGGHQSSRAADLDNRNKAVGSTNSADIFQASKNKDTSSLLDLPDTNLEMKKMASRYRGDASYSEIRPRTASGLEELKNERITPVALSMQRTKSDNPATSGVVQSAFKQVVEELGNLSLECNKRPDSRVSDSILLYEHDNMTPEEDPLDITGHSLPQNLSMGTQESGGHRTFSSRRRPRYLDTDLSHKGRPTSSMFIYGHLYPGPITNHRIMSSPPFYQPPHSIGSPSLPQPRPSVRTSVTEGQVVAKTETIPSSGSPLKLFGSHDTFTSNKLLRRMGQFEEATGDSSGGESDSPSEEARRKGENRFNLNAAKTKQSERHVGGGRPRSRNAVRTQINKFGGGQLDDFDFSDASLHESKLVYDRPPDDNVNRPTSSDRKQRHRFTLNRRSSLCSETAYSASSNVRQGSRRPMTSDAAASRRGRATKNGWQYRGTEWLSSTPVADPTPKRRRTIMRTTSADKENQFMEADLLRHEGDLSLLDKSLAQHGMHGSSAVGPLRLRSTQRSRATMSSQERPFAGEGTSTAGNRSQSSLDGQGHPACHPERRPIPVVKVIPDANEGRRKDSITTQDFLTEAVEIMRMIRLKGLNAGGLSDLEEPDAKDERADDEYEDESTQEEFVRPPSREGADIQKSRKLKAPDPRVLSHLRKFKESEELEFGASASFYLDKDYNLEPNVAMHERDDVGAAIARKRKYSTHFATGEDFRYLSARSIPTASSQSSRSKWLLSSDLVSHLIPDRVNGLTYDRLKYTWVKEQSKRALGTPKADDSENDPFSDIPNLSVDEIKETMGIQSYTPLKGASGLLVDEDASNKHTVDLEASATKPEVCPRATDGLRSVNGSSIQSKLTQYTSSIPGSDTRATSWSSNRAKQKDPLGDIEHEIQLHEDRSSSNNAQQARKVTISFSSPLVSRVVYDDYSRQKFSLQSQSSGDGADGHGTRARSDPDQTPIKPSRLPRRTPMSGQPPTQRTVSRIDEQNESTAEAVSLVRRSSAASVLRTPTGLRNEESLVKSAERTGGYSFHLCPLADFTVDQVDQSLQLEISYIAQRTHPPSLRQVHGAFALATEELVRHITSAQPFEPYWEHIRRLTLCGKKLITLHKLNEFCPHLEDLDVSDNEIGHLSGVPPSLRVLKIQRNRLSSLTAWGHLINLQYLDVSGNALESLDGFSALIHLRELKASDNNIGSINGILSLDGLLSLKLSNNFLDSVDFTGADLARLSELDLSHNRLTSIRNIDSLLSLRELDLSFNQINSVTGSRALRGLCSLKLSDNKLHAVDITIFPCLNLLYVDKNFLSTIMGLENCHNLEIFSAREQFAIAKDSCFDIDLSHSAEIRKVYLSSNRLSSRCLSPSTPLRNLQLLDVASCSIQSLPCDFALSFPNIKVLNLNFNSLTDIEELAHMSCVSRLSIAGNRISRLRAICRTLGKMGKVTKEASCSLEEVDLRANPLTFRFYPPPVTGSRAANQKTKKERRSHSCGLEKLGVDLPSVLAELGPLEDIDATRSVTWASDNGDEDKGIRPDTADDGDDSGVKQDITNNLYVLPAADLQEDRRYLFRLDDSTRLRRQVFELMLYTESGGSVKYLDGLQLRPSLEWNSEMKRTQAKLEALGVLKNNETIKVGRKKEVVKTISSAAAD